jgi:hypothetical protein
MTGLCLLSGRFPVTAALSELSTKPYYSAFGGQPGIPTAEFGSPASFGITGPGGVEKTVLRVPAADLLLRGHGQAIAGRNAQNGFDHP